MNSCFADQWAVVRSHVASAVFLEENTPILDSFFKFKNNHLNTQQGKFRSCQKLENFRFYVTHLQVVKLH